MRSIAQATWSFLDKRNGIQKCSVKEIKENRGKLIPTFQELVEHVATLSFRNPEFVFLFRGQQRDYVNRNGRTTLYPSIFRSTSNYMSKAESEKRFMKLRFAEDKLLEKYDLEGMKRIKTNRIIRWAILQHYEVCATPLLDVTHSLRVACSFAQYECDKNETYLYVLGLPQISGSVTSSSECGIQIIRLISICPPSALRPHYQEGYLIGEYPTIEFRSKLEYQRNELDFSNRLICKFRLGCKETFWDSDFSMISHEALFPDDRDRLKSKTSEIISLIQNE